MPTTLAIKGFINFPSAKLLDTLTVIVIKISIIKSVSDTAYAMICNHTGIALDSSINFSPSFIYSPLGNYHHISVVESNSSPT